MFGSEYIISTLFLNIEIMSKIGDLMLKNIAGRLIALLLIIVIFAISSLYLWYNIFSTQSNTSVTKLSENNGYYNMILRYADHDRCFTFLTYPINATSVNLIIYVHGGGFVGGSALTKNSMDVVEFFRKRGFAAASVEYRVCPKVNLTELLGDISKGIKIVLEYFNKNDIKINKAVYIGSSAGAIAGTLLIYTPPFPILDISQYIDGFIGFSEGYCASYMSANSSEKTRIYGVSIEYMMPFDKTSLKARERVPALLINGIYDKLLDKHAGKTNHHAICMEKWLKEHNISVKVLLLPTGHGTIGYLLKEDNKTVDIVMEFIESLKPKENLVAYWNFDNITGRRIIDAINGYTGEIIGDIKLVNGVIGNAIYFNGNGYISFSREMIKKIGSLEEGTISLWFKYKDVDQNVLPLLYFGSDRDGEDILFIIEIGHAGKHNRKLYVTWIVGGPRPILCFDTSFNLKPGKWYHIAIIVSRNGNTLYLNDIEIIKRHYNFGNPKMRYFFTDILVKKLFTLGYGRTGYRITKHFLFFMELSMS